MRKMTRYLLSSALSLSLMLVSAIPSFAGSWQFDGPEKWQWKYVNDSGSPAAPGWQQIDGKWYSFDENGYLNVGFLKIDDKFYLFSDKDDTLGEMIQNAQYLTGSFGADGAWVDKEPVGDTWRRWFGAKYGGGTNWSAEEDAAWQAQFQKYGITDELFAPHNLQTVGNEYQARLTVPIEIYGSVGALDISNSMMVKVFMLTDGMTDVSYSSWEMGSDGKNVTVSIFYVMGG